MTAFDALGKLTELMGRTGERKPSRVILRDGTSFLGTPTGLRLATKVSPGSARFAVVASNVELTVLVGEIRSIA